MLEDIKTDIINYGQIAGERLLTPGISGNISARCGKNIAITSSGSANAFLNPEDLCVINFDGDLIEGTKKPSSERLLHIEFYKKRKDVNAICHFHCPYLTAFAISGLPLEDKINPEIIFCFDKIPISEYALPGSKELVKNVSKYFDKYDVVLMQNHGVIAGGKNVKDAFLKLDLCENYAKSLVLSKFLGGAKILTENQVKEINLLKTENKE